MRWWKPVLGVAAVLAMGFWVARVPGHNQRPTTQPHQSSSVSTASPHPVAAKQPGVLQPKGTPQFTATFAGSRLNTSVWTTCYPWMDVPTGCRNFGNHEVEWYLPSQVHVSGGLLHLVAQHIPTAGMTANGTSEQYSCRSGMVTTYRGFRFKYGYIQVVARIPAKKGLWTGLWLAAANLHWPPEIDIVESWHGNYSAAYLHFTSGGYIKKPLPGKEAIGWHTFALSWTKTKLTWLLDGKVVFTAHRKIPHQEMYFIADLAETRLPLHGGCNGSLLIRSIKVWKG